jgi:hypothetical protein
MAADSRVSFYRPRDLTAEVVVAVLSLVGVRVERSIVERWTKLELLLAYDWAMRNHLRASDNPARLRDKPWFVQVAEMAQATPVKAEGWTVRFYDITGTQVGPAVPFDANWALYAPAEAATFRLSEGIPE